MYAQGKCMKVEVTARNFQWHEKSSIACHEGQMVSAGCFSSVTL